jgi:S-adenosylmethionine hydrolase
MSQFITLTTDFGTQDGYVGAMKGRILSICPHAQLIDISHDIEPQAVTQASWCLARSLPQFPPHTIHIAVIDPGVGSERFPLLVQTAQDHWLIGPDNGIFTEVLKYLPSVACYHIFRETAYWQAHRSFDGLAVFAPVAAHLANGLAPTEIGHPIEYLTLLETVQPQWQAAQLVGEVQMFDRFGNAITNITADLLQHTMLTTVYCQGFSFPLVTHYAEGDHYTAFALINSDGRLELAHYCGSARQHFGLQEKAIVTVR